MVLYARSDVASANGIPDGCGGTHSRPVVNGAPQHPWSITCPPCENWLRVHMADQWSTTMAEIPETYDETKVREDFEKRGAKDKDAILTLALARLAGIESHELPASLTRMVSGAQAHVPGQMECPEGHVQPSGMKFCGECGSPMHGSVSAGAISAPRAAPERPAAGVDMPSSGRLKDANKKSLQALCRAHGLAEDGTNGELVTRLSNAGLTIHDLARLAGQPVAA
jgi:hypothetical protein